MKCPLMGKVEFTMKNAFSQQAVTINLGTGGQREHRHPKNEQDRVRSLPSWGLHSYVGKGKTTNYIVNY